MKRTMQFTILTAMLGIAALFTACEKEDDPLTDLRPEIPVTVSNAFDFRPQPTVRTSKSAGGIITITLEIPAESGRLLREITKVAASTSYAAVQNSTTVGTNGLYVLGPLTGTGTNSITFTTSIAEYMTKTATTAVPANNVELGRQFFFIVTLDDNQVIITNPVRVFVEE